MLVRNTKTETEKESMLRKMRNLRKGVYSISKLALCAISDCSDIVKGKELE